MAIVDFDVTATYILSNYLTQFGVSNAALPDDSILDGKIVLASGKVGDSLLEGGFSASDVDSTTTPIAYQLLKDLVSRLGALYYVSAVGHRLAPETFKETWDTIHGELEQIKSGTRVGELVITTNSKRAVFVHSGNSIGDINDARAKVGDPL